MGLARLVSANSVEVRIGSIEEVGESSIQKRCALYK